MNDSRITPQSRHEARIHYVTAFIGGFLGIYPMLSAVHLFGSAQTSNMIECVFALIGRNWQDLFLHFTGVVLYALAVFVVTVMVPRTGAGFVKIVALVVDVCAGFVMWLLPQNLPVTVYFYPTFLAMAFQWSAFSGSYGFICSTIFSTNNLKQFVSSIAEVTVNRKKEFKLKAAFFGLTLIAFHLGVCASFLLWKYLGFVSFVFVIVPAVIDLIMILYRKNDEAAV